MPAMISLVKTKYTDPVKEHNKLRQFKHLAHCGWYDQTVSVVIC